MTKIKLTVFNIVLNETEVYTPGSEVSGNCVIHLKGEMNLSQLEIKLKGKTFVCFPKGRYSSVATHQFLSLSYWPERGLTPRVLTVGEHHIPFCFQLPKNRLNDFGNIPSSMEIKYRLSPFGWVRYYVKAEIHNLSRNHKTRLPITIRSPPYVPYLLTEPIEKYGEKTFGLWFSKGCVSLKCETTFVQLVGKDATIQLNADNRSNSQITLRATLKRIIYYTNGSDHHKQKKKLLKVVGPNILSNSSISECLTLPLPSDLPIVHNQSPLINIEYEIVVTLDIRCALDLHVKLPIIVTNRPLVEPI